MSGEPWKEWSREALWRKWRASEAEVERLYDLINRAARPFLALDPGVPFEGAIDSAMEAACAEIERARKLASLQATRWSLELERIPWCGEITLEIVRNSDGPDRWAIFENGHEGRVLGSDLRWAMQPLPSSRDDEWCAKYRFPTAMAAIYCWRLYKAQMGAAHG